MKDTFYCESDKIITIIIIRSIIVRGFCLVKGLIPILEPPILGERISIKN